MIDKPIYIIDGLRTAIGRPYRSLKHFSIGQLSSFVIKELVKRNEIKKDAISKVILGNTVSAGVGQNFARKAIFLADLPTIIPAYTVNNVCGSSLQALIIAANGIRSGDVNIIVAGGAESATNTPNLTFYGMKEEDKKKDMDSLIKDGLTCSITNQLMGNLCERIAQENNISRKEQDEYSIRSHQKACSARDEGKFAEEIVPIKINDDKTFSNDECPRNNINLNRLELLSPSFSSNGTLTAGNSSLPSDGAAAVIMASEETVKKEQLSPKAKIIGFNETAVDPSYAFGSAEASIRKCLKDCSLSIEDIDIFEICESFSAQAIVTRKALFLPDDKVNIWGGDIALGHPLGAAGTRILVTLIHALIDQKKKRGLCSVCFGGGGAISVIVEVI